jgi:hypothetical protein
MTMAGAFWCVVEDDRKGTPKKVMAEVLGEAARLGGPVEAVWLTDKATDDGLKQLGAWGATKVWLLEDAALAPYRGEVWVPPLAALVAKESPKAILAPVTSRQREFMARLAAKLGAGLSADSVALALEGDTLVATRPVYAGKLLSKVTWAKQPWLATLRPNVFKPADAQAGKSAAVERVAVTAPAAQMTFIERREEASTGLPELTEAEIVLSGGRGMKGPENYVILGGGLPGGGGRRLATAPLPDRPDRPDHLAQALHGVRRVRRHPAPGRHADVEGDRGDQQGRRGADLQDRRLRDRGRPVRGRAGADERVQAAPGEMN